MRPPAFQCYADDLLAGTAEMTAEEFGVYWRLICHSWNKGGLPNDDQRLALMAGQCSGTAVAYAKTKFEVGEDGLLRNPRLEKVRQEQENYSKMQSEKAHLRWDTIKKNGHAAAYAPAQPKQCSPSPSPSPTPKTGIISQTSHSTPKPRGTRLTFSALSRMAQDIKENRTGWHYDNHKLNPESIVTAGLVGKLRPFVDRLTEQQVREAWAEAALKTHQAAVDGMNITHSLAHYAVGIWRDEMEKLATPISD